MTEQKKLTQSDYDGLYYWFFERGDLERWCRWGEVRPLFAVYHPELINAISLVESAQKVLNETVEKVVSEGTTALANNIQIKPKCPPCTHCGGPSKRVIDPYKQDVENVEVWTDLCDDCYQLMCDEV